MINKEEYNRIPVHYCANCLSLKIIRLSVTTSYCDKCGNTDIRIANIKDWEKLYNKTHGEDFLNTNKNNKLKNYGRY